MLLIMTIFLQSCRYLPRRVTSFAVRRLHVPLRHVWSLSDHVESYVLPYVALHNYFVLRCFYSYFPVWLVLLCGHTRYVGISLVYLDALAISSVGLVLLCGLTRYVGIPLVYLDALAIRSVMSITACNPVSSSFAAKRPDRHYAGARDGGEYATRTAQRIPCNIV